MKLSTLTVKECYFYTSLQIWLISQQAKWVLSQKLE